ncbi:MAG TPA: hypothetical protein VFD59_20310 [Nocardioidaceae bacterium]|nr:hypothetical protein [Nocardioidaceae bacterium]
MVRKAMAVLVVCVLMSAGGSAIAGGTWKPPGDTITRITGTQGDGFTVHRYDGSVDHLPTTSEATAECGEYAGRIRRVRCRTTVRTWYDDLAATKRAIRYARGRGTAA